MVRTVLYKRYIDNIMAVLEESEESLMNFIKTINKNKYNLSFTADINTTRVNYLDPNLFKIGNRISTKTYFKET